MADVATLQADLDAINAILNAGVSVAYFDGQRIEYDLAALERRAASLQRQIDASSVSQFKRVTLASNA